MTLTLSSESIAASVAKLSFRTEAFIDGKFQPARSGQTFPTENPANGKTITHVAACEAEDVDLAVRAARKAFESGVWSKMRPVDRKKTLLAFADRLPASRAEPRRSWLAGHRDVQRPGILGDRFPLRASTRAVVGRSG